MLDAGGSVGELSTLFAICSPCVVERRLTERRITRDRRAVGLEFDLMRPEHEILFRQVDELVRMVHRIEHQISTVMKRLDQLENRAAVKRIGAK